MTERTRRSRPARRRQQQGWWRAAFVVGALGASLLGSELIASREVGLAREPVRTVISVPVRQPDGAIDQQRLELAPVPTAVPRGQMPTIARSRSSR